MAVSQYDFVNVESGTDETYVPLDQEPEVYDAAGAIDEINGSIVTGTLETKIDYLADTKSDIREAIIDKGVEVAETDPFRSYAEKIGEIVGGEPNNQDITVTENGVYEAESGYTGLGEVTVEVPEPVLDPLSVTQNGNYEPSGDGYSSVSVNVQPTLENKTIRVNGTYTAGSGYDGFGTVEVDVADIPAVVEPLSVTPTTTQQVITPSANVDGFNKVTVAAVDSSIDSNIAAGNIVSGVSILGVNGSATVLDGETVSITPTTSQQVITPTSPHNGITQATVAPVTSAIDSNIAAGNIKSGVSILGVAGSVEELNADDSLIVIPAKTGQTIRPTSPYNAFSEVGVLAVTSSIDSNIQAANIKDGVSILGVTGSAALLDGEQITVTPTTSQQVITPTSPHNGITQVTVNAVTSAIDPDIEPQNIVWGAEILGVAGTAIPANATTLNVTPTTYAQYLRPSAPYNTFGEVNVSAVTNTIDSNITAGNIKDGVTILGVLGTYTGMPPSDYYRLFEKDANGVLVNSRTTPFIPLPAGTKDLSAYCLAYAYLKTPANVLSGSVSLSPLEKITGTYSAVFMLADCAGITSADLSSITSISGDHACYNMFAWDYGLITADLSSLVAITGSQSCSQMFLVCSALVNVYLSSLTEVSGFRACNSMFSNCTSLLNLFFPSLSSTGFGTQTSQFLNMLNAVTGCTVHFPSNLQSVIGSWSDVQNGFGGTNTTVLFDLPATVTLVGTNSYYRNPKYDTATALAWFDTSATRATPYYTSGTTDPVVNSAIYSDASCTTQVDTIASIS